MRSRIVILCQRVPLLVVAVSYAFVLGLAGSLLWSCCDCLNLTKPHCSSSSSFARGLFYIPFVLFIRLAVCFSCSSWVGDWQIIFMFREVSAPAGREPWSCARLASVFDILV